MDRRSGEIADRWHGDGTAADLYSRTGAPVHAMLPSCKLRWLAEHDPGLIERAARFVSMKELLIHRWTDEWMVDWGIASATGLFDVRKRDWDPRALEEARVPQSKLSFPVPTSTTRRAINPSVAASLGLQEGVTLVLCSSDGALANLGVGAVGAGELALTLGTSGAVRVVVDEVMLDAAGRTFCYAFDDNRYIAGGPTSSAGAVLARLFQLFLSEVSPEERTAHAIMLAEAAAPGAEGLTVLPFLGGERAPYWLSELRGGMIGLDLAHAREEIFRASFESVVFALATVLDVLRERVGTLKRIRLSGGLTHAAFVRQLVADVFDSQAVLSDQEEASAFGAAMMAAIVVGAIDDASAVAALLEPAHVHEPNPAMVERYRDVFARYRACVDAILPLYKR
jgi:gluconokinase